MPLDTRELDLAAERDALTERMEAMAEQQARAPVGSDAAQQAAQEGQQAERYRAGIAWALDEWDTDTVTISSITSGERDLVRDVAEETGWNLVNCYVAAGTYAAPYLEHDPEQRSLTEFKRTARNIADLHPGFVDWIEERIAETSRVDGDLGNSYRDLVLARRSAQATGTDSE